MADDQWDPNRYSVDPRIMITAVLCLFFVVVIVLLLHFYARYVLRLQARRLDMARLNQLRSRIGETAAQAQTRPVPPKTGLDASVISALPTFSYKSCAHAVDCPVCLSALEENVMARILPNCKHMFHAQCIDMWLYSNSTCPVCRAEAAPRAGKAGEIALQELPPDPEAATGDARQVATTSDSASTLRLSSFKRILSRERSERSVQACGQGQAVVEDLERQ